MQKPCIWRAFGRNSGWCGAGATMAQRSEFGSTREAHVATRVMERARRVSARAHSVRLRSAMIMFGGDGSAIERLLAVGGLQARDLAAAPFLLRAFRRLVLQHPRGDQIERSHGANSDPVEPPRGRKRPHYARTAFAKMTQRQKQKLEFRRIAVRRGPGSRDKRRLSVDDPANRLSRLLPPLRSPPFCSRCQRALTRAPQRRSGSRRSGSTSMMKMSGRMWRIATGSISARSGAARSPFNRPQ
ncbi:MAG: hypothetical protein FD172_3384 [Methylocystaceae bacterium]|nr:MAG: hypothetical protein FD172_3384 [Methylocystaceae bacterium]